MMTARFRLQSLLAFDAATCAMMGILLLLAGDRIAAITQLPAPLLFWSGVVLMPVAVFMGFLYRANDVPVWAARMVIAANGAWVLASIALPVVGLVRPNVVGWALLLGQAAGVAMLARLERAASGSPSAVP